MDGNAQKTIFGRPCRDFAAHPRSEIPVYREGERSRLGCTDRRGRSCVTVNTYQRPSDRNFREQRCEKAMPIGSNCRSRSVRRVAGTCLAPHPGSLQGREIYPAGT